MSREKYAGSVGDAFRSLSPVMRDSGKRMRIDEQESERFGLRPTQEGASTRRRLTAEPRNDLESSNDGRLGVHRKVLEEKAWVETKRAKAEASLPRPQATPSTPDANLRAKYVG